MSLSAFVRPAVIREQKRLVVMGSGAVYVVDGMRESYTNVFEEQPDTRTSVPYLPLHILRDATLRARDAPARSRPVEGTGAAMNNVAKTTWTAIAILLAIILITFIATRGGQ